MLTDLSLKVADRMLWNIYQKLHTSLLNDLLDSCHKGRRQVRLHVMLFEGKHCYRLIKQSTSVVPSFPIFHFLITPTMAIKGWEFLLVV